MSKIKKLISRAVFAPVMLVFMLTLSGCGDPGDKSNNNPPPPPKPQPAPTTVKVEFRPPESGEHLRRHIFDASGREIETQIEFADNHMGYLYFRKDGSLRETKETHPGGKVVKTHATYADDGKTVVAQEDFRLDSSLEKTFKLSPDGTKTTTAYRVDGKRLSYVEVVKTDSSAEKTFYRKDGTTLWAVFHTTASGEKSADCYGVDGKLDHKRVFRSDSGIDITSYRADGTVRFKQAWRSTYGGWYYRYYALEWAEEYQSDGVTLARRLNYSYDGRNLRSAHIFDANGVKTSIRYIRDDGTVEREEFLDASGKVTKTDTHTVAEGIKETVDDSLKNRPAFDDPSEPNRRDLDQ